MAAVKKLAKKHFKSLIDHLQAYQEESHPETLHKIRVDIKKIKSILQLTNEVVKGFKAHKNFIPFRTLFRRAGEIREPEIINGLLLRYNIPRAHDKLIAINGKELIIRFLNDVPFFISMVNEKWKRLKADFKGVKKKDIRSYLKKVNKIIRSKLLSKSALDIIHKIRKSMKEFIYLSELDSRSKKKLKKFYVSVAERIGELHDHQVLLDIMNKPNAAGDDTTLKNIKQKCDSEKMKIKKKVLRFYRN